MSDLQTLIDRLGQPPPEVCLDWALQLANLDCGRYGTTLGKVDSQASPAIPARWADVNVTPEGRLQLRSQPTIADTLVTVEPLIEQLLEWSEPQRTQALRAAETSSAGNTLPAKPWQRRLAQRAMQLATAVEQEDTRAEDGEHDTQPRQPLASLSPASQVAHTRTNKIGQPYKRPNKTGRRSKLPKPSSKRKLIVIAGIASLLVMTVSFAWHVLTSTVDVAVDNSSPALPGQAIEGTPTLSAAEIQSDAIMLQDSADLLATATLQEQGLLETFRDDFSLAVLSESTDAFEPAVQKGSSDTSGQVGADTQAALGFEIDPQAPSAGSEASVAIDVLAEFESLSQSAEGQPSEKMIPTELPSDPIRPALTARTPLSISTFPMLQVQRLDIAIRARKPNWTLRLKTSDGFVITPAGPQTISGRETAGWTIQADEAADTMPQVLVQVQLTGNRSSALRWSVMAKVQDLPQVAMPLGQEFLGGLQVRLRQCDQLLQAEIERLRGLAGVDGLPTEVRSAMSARRRGLEAQSKMANRLLEFVADAMQIDGWLDGQIEVHAQLSDAASADSTPLLQFGELEPSSAASATKS